MIISSFQVEFKDRIPSNPLKFEVDNGVIFSENHPNNYTANLRCVYLIEAPPGSRLVNLIPKCLILI